MFIYLLYCCQTFRGIGYSTLCWFSLVSTSHITEIISAKGDISSYKVFSALYNHDSLKRKKKKRFLQNFLIFLFVLVSNKMQLAVYQQIVLKARKKTYSVKSCHSWINGIQNSQQVLVPPGKRLILWIWFPLWGTGLPPRFSFKVNLKKDIQKQEIEESILLCFTTHKLVLKCRFLKVFIGF